MPNNLRPHVTFEYIREIGQEGANSQAYLAHDKNLDAKIVIKQIKKSSFNSSDQYFNESQILYKNDHPYIVKVLYASQCERYIYLALPYYENGSLKGLMNRRNLTVREIVKFSIQICTALHKIHTKGLIHFDIKPDNILLSNRNDALLSDFGLAKYLDDSGTITPGNFYVKHLVPDFITRKAVDARHDIYQFGLTLYRMCNGNTDFDNQFASFIDDNYNLLKESFINSVQTESFPARNYKAHIPLSIKKIIRKCLKPNINERYSSMMQIANELAGIDEPHLDWLYSLTEHDETWEKETQTHCYKITVNTTDQSSIAHKKTISGSWTKVKDYCCSSLTEKQLQNFLKLK